MQNPPIFLLGRKDDRQWIDELGPSIVDFGAEVRVTVHIGCSLSTNLLRRCISVHAISRQWEYASDVQSILISLRPFIITLPSSEVPSSSLMSAVAHPKLSRYRTILFNNLIPSTPRVKSSMLSLAISRFLVTGFPVEFDHLGSNRFPSASSPQSGHLPWRSLSHWVVTFPVLNQDVAFAAKFRSRQKLRYQCQNLAFLQVLEVSKHNQSCCKAPHFTKKIEGTSSKNVKLLQKKHKKGDRGIWRSLIWGPRPWRSLITCAACGHGPHALNFFSPITPWLRRRPISCTHLLCSATWPA